MAKKDILKEFSKELFPDNDDGLIEPVDMRRFNDAIIDFIPENASGDLTGEYPNPKVRVGRTIYTGAPTSGNGVLVETNISTISYEQVFGEIRGNTNGSRLTTFTTFQFYSQAASIVAGNACHYGYPFGNISVFGYNDKIYMWFPDTGGYQFINVSLRVGETARVVNMTMSIMPSGITKLINIKPVTAILSDTPAAGALSGQFPNLSIVNNAILPNHLCRYMASIYPILSASGTAIGRIVSIKQFFTSFDFDTNTYKSGAWCLSSGGANTTFSLSTDDFTYFNSPQSGVIVIANDTTTSKQLNLYPRIGIADNEITIPAKKAVLLGILRGLDYYIITSVREVQWTN